MMKKRISTWMGAAVAGAATVALAAAALAVAGESDGPGTDGGFVVQRVLSTPVNDPSADTTARDTQIDPSVVAVGSNVVVAWQDTGARVVDGSQATGYARSANAGLSFTDLGSLPPSVDGEFGPPALAADQTTGAIYLASRRWWSDDSLQFFKSTDGGQSFGAPIDGSPGFDLMDTRQTQPHIAVNNHLGPGNGYIHQCWTETFESAGGGHQVWANGSTNGGASFDIAAELISLPGSAEMRGGANCHVAIGTDDAVYVFYVRGDGAEGLDGDNRIYVRKSADFGATFLAEVQVADLASSRIHAALFHRESMYSYTFPQAAVSSFNGVLYLVYQDDPTAGDTGDQGDVLLVRSGDGGASWSTPVMINDDDADRDQYQPVLAFTPDGRRAMLAYYSRSNDPANLLFHRRGRLATLKPNGGLAFGASFQLSADSRTVFNQDPAAGQSQQGSRDGIAATATHFHSTWSDNLLGNAVHAAQPDVRYARIDAAPTVSDLALQVSAPGAINQGSFEDVVVTVSAALATATDVFVQVGVPAELVVRSAMPATGNCRRSGASVGCYVGNVPAGTSRAIHLLVGGVEPAARSITAVATTSSSDPGPGVNSASAAVTVNAVPSSVRIVQTGAISVPTVDLGSVDIPLDMPEEGTVLDVNAYVRIAHGFDADLDLFLVSPSGRVVELSTDNGGFGDDYGSGSLACNGSFTTFNDSATVPVMAGLAPFSGGFRPEQPLSDMVNEPADGTWKLRVADDLEDASGTVGCFRLRFVMAN